MPRPLDGRIALVTGASRGIGRAVALELARAGAHVIALARTKGALNALDDAIRSEDGEATLVPCDQKDFDALDRLGAAIFEQWGKVDVFIGNAGVLGPVTPLAHVEPRQWEDALAVNVTAIQRLIRSLDPLLRTAEAGRVIFVSSSAGHAAQPKPYWPYAIAKAAPDALTRSYAAETMNISRVKVMAFNPGPVRTKMRGGNARRAPQPEDARRARAEDPRALRPRMDANKQALRFPHGSRAKLHAAFVNHRGRDDARRPKTAVLLNLPGQASAAGRALPGE